MRKRERGRKAQREVRELYHQMVYKLSGYLIFFILKNSIPPDCKRDIETRIPLARSIHTVALQVALLEHIENDAMSV